MSFPHLNFQFLTPTFFFFLQFTFSPSDKQLAAGSSDGRIYFFNTDGTVAEKIEDGNGEVRSSN